MEMQKILQRNLYLVLTPVILMLLLSSCKGRQAQPQKPPVPVTAAEAVQKDFPVQISTIGNVEAYSTVSVKSRIGGVLTGVHFREGQYVNKGELLFTIDPRPYEAALKQAEANLAKDKALLENAREEAGRYAELVKKGYVARQEYDRIRTNASSIEATVNADSAVVENARLQLKYCYIYSPITGRTGDLAYKEGNLIKENAENPIVVINRIQPIYVTFSVPEQYLAEIKKYMSGGKVKVRAFVTKDENNPEEGVLSFIDNTIDTATGTIKMKAEFTNNSRKLWPGQFVSVTVLLTTQPNAVVVPSYSIQTGQNGQYVFVIKDDLSVDARPIVAGRTLNNETVVENGLSSGEKVVTDGHLKLIPGAKVQIKDADTGSK